MTLRLYFLSFLVPSIPTLYPCKAFPCGIFQRSYPRNLGDGSAILTAQQRYGTNQGKPGAWACFLKVSEGVPGSSGPPSCCSRFPIYFCWLSSTPPSSDCPHLGGHRRQERCTSPGLPISWPCAWKLVSWWLRMRACAGDTAVYCPWAVWFLSPWFYSLLMTFSKVLWAPKLFPQSFLFLFLTLKF